jgi:single-strand DNA-binding protein
MYQNTIVVGHLGDDPKMKYTQTGQAVTDFRMATTRKWKNQEGETQEKTTWFRVSVWGKQAEACNQYLAKGRLVLVEGDIDASAWVGQDGQPRASLELRARNVRFLGGRGGQGEGSGERGAASADDEGDLPF